MASPMTREQADQLSREAEASFVAAEVEDRRGNLLLARSLRSIADDKAQRAAAGLRALAASIEPEEVAAFLGVCLCAVVLWAASWVLFA